MEDLVSPEEKGVIVHPYEFQRPRRFWDDFNHSASTSTGEVGLKVFLFESAAMSDQLRKTFGAARACGAEVEFQIDSISRLRNEPMGTGGTWYSFCLDGMEKDGVNVVEVKTPRKAPLVRYTSRSHMKLAYVTGINGVKGNDLAWLGGMNFTPKSLERDDLMVRITDPVTVGVIRDIFHLAGKSAWERRNLVIPIGESTKVLVDTGVFGKSCILDRAVEMVQESAPGEKIRVVTPFPPLGVFSRVLRDSMGRGVDVEIVCANPKSLSLSFPGYYLLASSAVRSRDLPVHTLPGLVHTKLLLVGDRLLTGSHNFDAVGKVLCTEEIAIETNDEYLVEQARNYCEERLRP